MNYRNSNRQGGYSQNRGYNNGGRNQGGQQGYHPNTGKLRLNREKQSPKQPDFKGVGNVEINGVQHTIFVSLWFNQDQNTGEETIRLTFTQPNAPQQGNYQPRQQGGGYRREMGGHQQPQQPPFGVNGHPSNWYGQGQEPGYNPPQNGAMSRARPIPPQPQYDDGPPPYTEYPEGPEPGGFEPDEGGGIPY